jgi:serine/threonine protein kinase
MPPARAIHLVMQACAALEEAHAAKIIHRDLKPHNLYLTRGEAEPDFIKLLDFGIARLRVEDHGNEHLTQTGTMVDGRARDDAKPGCYRGGPRPPHRASGCRHALDS